MKKIILFYKSLIKPGGAERLLLKEYSYFKKMGYLAQIVCLEFNNSSLFFNNIEDKALFVLKGKYELLNIFDLAGFIKHNKPCIFICNSGHVSYYLANLIARSEYYLHLHQPSSMSVNEYDKFSFFKRKVFKRLEITNYSANRFIRIKQSFGLSKSFYINMRSILSSAAIKKARSVFVLSDFAVREKKLMYGIQAVNLSGALDDSIFQYKPKDIKKFGTHKNKLLTVARLDDKDKRVDILIMAFAIFLKQNPDSILIIGGSGSEYQNLLDLSIELKIETNVKFVGFIPDELLYDYYAWADLFVSIDWADFRITSYEAMAMMTKVLLSNETDADKSLIETGYYYLTEPTVQETVININKALCNKKIITKKEFVEILKNHTWDKYFLNMEKIVCD